MTGVERSDFESGGVDGTTRPEPPFPVQTRFWGPSVSGPKGPFRNQSYTLTTQTTFWRSVTDRRPTGENPQYRSDDR